MIVTICVIASVLLLYACLSMYLNRKWVLYSTTFGYENYFKLVSRLQQSGIRYKTKTPLGTQRHRDLLGNRDNTQYDIYVKKEDEGRPLQ
ncbi:hypothetical protein [Bacillus sp. AK128]